MLENWIGQLPVMFNLKLRYVFYDIYFQNINLHPVIAVVGQVKPSDAWQSRVDEQRAPYVR